MKIRWPSGITEQSFLAEYWQQKPLLIRGAFESFENPIDANELAGLACEEDANARYIEHTGNNEWRLCAGPLSDDFFDDVTGNEWSLLVSDVEKLLPDFKEYLQPFRFLPDWRIDDLMISYAPVGGSVGAHVDHYDVFLLQADGAREWRVENKPRLNRNTTSVSQSIAILGDFDADESWELKAGDMLYLPPQFAHHGIAITEPCMTWSIGFRAPSVDEMLPEIVNYLLESKAATKRFTDPNRKTTRHPGLIHHDDMAALRQMLRDALTQPDDTIDQWIGRCVTEPKEIHDETENTNDISAAMVRDHLNSGHSLIGNSQKRTAYTPGQNRSDKNTATLFADGKHYQCSVAIAEAVCDRNKVSSDEAKDSIDLLTVLCQQQVLLLEKEDNIG